MSDQLEFGVEPLESRLNLANYISLDAGVLMIRGSGRSDVAAITQSGLDLLVTVNSQSQLFSVADVQEFVFEGRGGNDQFTNSSFIPGIAMGGAGRDTLIGGSNGDTLNGQRGRDNLQGNEGNDTIMGGGGRDSIWGNTGNDMLFGNGGRDDISGGPGNDMVNGDGGRDNLNGDGGSNQVHGGRGRDIVAGGKGSVVSGDENKDEAVLKIVEDLEKLIDLQITVEVRFITLEDEFFTQMGVDFDFDLSDDGQTVGTIQFDSFESNFSGRMDVDIRFENGDYLGGMSFDSTGSPVVMEVGFAILSDIEAFFLIEAAEADNRRNVLQAPTVTLFNGQSASVSDTAQRPFVTSVIPVVG